MARSNGNETFERKGGYASPSVPRSEMKPPPASASASRPKPSQGDSQQAADPKIK